MAKPSWTRMLRDGRRNQWHGGMVGAPDLLRPSRGRAMSLPFLLLFQVFLDCVGARPVNSPNTIPTNQKCLARGCQ